jgi:stalled ribosome rescue protein Dom34
MNTYVVWLETDVAKIFNIQGAGTEKKIIKRHEVKHHTNNDRDNHKDAEKFFHEVANELKDGNEILLVGPGLAKEHFKAHLTRHHHTALAKSVVGTETSDRITDNEILALSRKFFKHYDVFGKKLEA